MSRRNDVTIHEKSNIYRAAGVFYVKLRITEIRGAGMSAMTSLKPEECS